MKKTRKRWSLVSAVVAFGLIAAFVPWQAFGQEGLSVVEDTATDVSIPVEQDAEDVSLEEDSEKASEVLPLPDTTTVTEDAFVLDENTDDVVNETTDTSTEASSLDESDTLEQEAEDTPPPCSSNK